MSLDQSWSLQTTDDGHVSVMLKNIKMYEVCIVVLGDGGEPNL